MSEQTLQIVAQGIGLVVSSVGRGVRPWCLADESFWQSGWPTFRRGRFAFSRVRCILFITYVCIPWIPATLLAVGFVWLGLTLVFDVGFGRFGLHRSWEDIGSDFDMLHGGMFPIGLAVLTLSPLIAARWRGSSTRPERASRT